MDKAINPRLRDFFMKIKTIKDIIDNRKNIENKTLDHTNIGSMESIYENLVILAWGGGGGPGGLGALRL